MSGLLALTLGLGVSSATFAYQGDYTKKGPNYSQEFESEMTRVMLNNDYDGWRNLVENKVGRVDELITRENFPKFAEAWRLAKEGKIKEANIIRKELGLRTPDGVRNRVAMMKGGQRGARGMGMMGQGQFTNR
ncbi:hypothetical protein A2565_02725 [Candidatus Nomurabacteria bacterium RIFOXYD1_FULL_36_19]|nr:MAG: hypothetical protein A2565_02725 [Candidatus Nomurabacteria bacterium RIFOXYD1_FULL_36_19]